ncbi:MAG: Uma2 family endonuclease [Leptolyngbyaceae cyanobacterium]
MSNQSGMQVSQTSQPDVVQVYQKTWPTMYDLPSQNPGEPGLPDEFHDLQPQLLSRTLRLADYASDRCFTGTDMNLYYDAEHPLWHKRPDWFLVVDVPRLYAGQDLRNSFVVWDEGKTPRVIVELLSPGREEEDLWIYTDERIEENLPGALAPYTIEADESGVSPPHKWIVYEQVLQVPYYLVFSRYSNRLRYFKLVDRRYQEQGLDRVNPRAWLPDLGIGLGLWQGEFDGITRLWLRWYDETGNWILTPTEGAALRAEREALQAEHERQRADQAELRIAQLEQKLREFGLEP